MSSFFNRFGKWILLGLLILVSCFLISLMVLSAYRLDTANNVRATQIAEVNGMYANASATAAAPTATLAPTLTPTLAPTATPFPATATKAPTIAPTATSTRDPYEWSYKASTVKYENKTAMLPGMTFKGTGLCEFWDGINYDFDAVYDVKTDTVKVNKLYEGFFYLLKGQSYTFPVGFQGTCWSIPTDDDIELLAKTERHLLFYANTFGNDSKEIKALKDAGKIWSEMVVQGKNHGYMEKWLKKYNLGPCNFHDQKGCKYLALVIVQPPLGTTIK